MRNLILGFLIGSALTGTVVGAGTFYDKSGTPSGPAGSIQQFDYFRQRQFFLDQSALRRAQEEQLRHDRLTPCAR